jgi:2-C-methyl-D-erythritol 2,4-cyclodiphosphate synthase
VTMSHRVGLGIDAHRLEPGRPLMLGTVRIEHPSGLAGHSDGDVVAHALCDALLSAIGDDDIGVVFPGTPEWAGVSGERMLQVVAARVVEAGYKVANAHAVVICEAPKLAPHREAMQQALSAIVGAPVSVHATTTDGMGATGRGEGIACQAVVLLETA